MLIWPAEFPILFGIYPEFTDSAGSGLCPPLLFPTTCRALERNNHSMWDTPEGDFPIAHNLVALKPHPKPTLLQGAGQDLEGQEGASTTLVAPLLFSIHVYKPVFFSPDGPLNEVG